MSDVTDLSGESIARHPETGPSTLFIYYISEVGRVSRAIYEMVESLCRRTRGLVVSRSCGLRGCPGRVMDHMCGDDNRPMHIEAAGDPLDAVLDAIEE